MSASVDPDPLRTVTSKTSNVVEQTIKVDSVFEKHPRVALISPLPEVAPSSHAELLSSALGLQASQAHIVGPRLPVSPGVLRRRRQIRLSRELEVAPAPRSSSPDDASPTPQSNISPSRLRIASSPQRRSSSLCSASVPVSAAIPIASSSSSPSSSSDELSASRLADDSSPLRRGSLSVSPVQQTLLSVRAARSPSNGSLSPADRSLLHAPTSPRAHLPSRASALCVVGGASYDALVPLVTTPAASGGQHRSALSRRIAPSLKRVQSLGADTTLLSQQMVGGVKTRRPHAPPVTISKQFTWSPADLTLSPASNGAVEAEFTEAAHSFASKTDDLSMCFMSLKTWPVRALDLVSVESIDVSNNKLTALPADFGTIYPNLTVLQLQANGLRELPESFAQLVNLTELDLSNNNLGVIAEPIFQLTKLTELRFAWNSLSVLPEGIGQLTQLDLLDLNGNMIAVLPLVVDSLVELRSLNLRNNRLAKIEATFSPLNKLKRLCLQENRLTEVPEGLSKLVHITDLQWYANCLYQVPDTLHLMKITALNLSLNHLGVLDLNGPSSEPPAFAETLERLIAEDNKIQAIAPSTLRPLVKCTLLRLNRNCIARIPSDIQYMVQLQTIELIQNQLTVIPEELGLLAHLRVLNVSRNRIKSTESLSKALSKMEFLWELDLGSNCLTEVPETIGQMKNLYSLNLFNNYLTTLPETIGEITAFVDIHAASRRVGVGRERRYVGKRRLILSYNEFTEVPKVVEKLVALDELHFAGNRLSHIQPTLFAALQNLSTLSFACNDATKLLHLPETVNVLGSLQKLYLRGSTLGCLPSSIFDLLDPYRAALAELDISRDTPIPKGKTQSFLKQSQTRLVYTKDPLTDQKRDTVTTLPIAITSKMLGNDPLGPFRVGVAKMTGRANKNEDCVVCRAQYRLNPGDAFYAVYDGHGGKHASAFAAENLHKIFADILDERDAVAEAGEKPISMSEALRSAFLRTNTQMYNYFIERCINERRGSTAVVAFINGNDLYVANAGDARAVFCYGDHVIRLSRDHKPTSEDEVERIRRLGGLVMPDKNGNGTQYRVTQMFKLSGFGGVAMSRALGDFHLSPLLEPEPWVSYTDLGPVMASRASQPPEEREDCILILACDGVWDVLSDREAIAVVRGEPDEERAAVTLRDTAYLSGSNDDISCIVIRWK